MKTPFPRRKFLKSTLTSGAAAFDCLVSEHNREVIWADCTHRGFVKLVLTPESPKAEYVSVDTIHSEHYVSSVLRRMEIVKRGNSLAFY